MTTFHLPDLGEGLPDAEISKWFVKEGDIVAIDDPLVAMETAKAVVDVPSPIAGKIVKLHGEPGDVINTGAPLVEFFTTEPGVKVQMTRDAGTVAGKLETSDTVIEEYILLGAAKSIDQKIKTTPAIRALAGRLNVDLASLQGSGPNGAITRQDVEQAHAKPKLAAVGEGFVQVKGTRRNMAQVMSQSHASIVPVTVMDDAVLLHWSKETDITVQVIQAVAAASKIEPALNAWFDGQSMSRKFFEAVHLGLAVDTEDGLFVPVMRDVEKKSSKQLREALEQIKNQVQARTIPPEDLKGATITVSNFGKFAGRYANPIIVPPQVAILGVGRIREEVVVVNGETAVAKVLPLALTIDHRACTGGEATRFLGAVIEQLQR